MRSSGRDWLGPRGSQELATKIESYWLDRGHRNVDVRVNVDGFIGTGTERLYSVRSNLVNGAPPR